MTPDQLAFLLQVSDGNFPNGAFSHSFGLETLIDQGVIVDGHSFRQELEDWLYLQLFPFEGLAAHLAWAYAKDADIASILQIAQIVTASILPSQAKMGTLQIGQRSLQVFHELLSHGMTSQYWTQVQEKRSQPVFFIALSVAAADIGISQELTVTTVLYTALSNMVTAAVRAIPLGQTAGQRILADCRRWLEKIPIYQGYTMEDLSATSPLWEIAQMNHKYQDGRLFMS